MSKELIVQQNNELAGFVNMLERVAVNPEVDVEKMSRLLDMQERILNRKAYQEYCAAFAQMQADLPQVQERGTGHNSTKYALLEDIVSEVKPYLQKHGFAISFKTIQQPGTITTKAILMHKGGHAEETEITLPADASGSKNAVQAVGSSCSYGRRYAMCSILNIATGEVDDDARTFDKVVTEAQAKVLQGYVDRLSDAGKEAFHNATGGAKNVKSKDFGLELAKLKNSFGGK